MEGGLPLRYFPSILCPLDLPQSPSPPPPPALASPPPQLPPSPSPAPKPLPAPQSIKDPELVASLLRIRTRLQPRGGA